MRLAAFVIKACILNLRSYYSNDNSRTDAVELTEIPTAQVSHSRAANYANIFYNPQSVSEATVNLAIETDFGMLVPVRLHGTYTLSMDQLQQVIRYSGFNRDDWILFRFNNQIITATNHKPSDVITLIRPLKAGILDHLHLFLEVAARLLEGFLRVNIDPQERIVTIKGYPKATITKTSFFTAVLEELWDRITTRR